MDAIPFRFRLGTPREIEVLKEIDLDASDLFVRAGLDMDLPADHEFCTAEHARWMRSLASGQTLVAVGLSGQILGFASSGVLDGEAHLDQLSVRTQFMHKGIGTALLWHAAGRACERGASALWLTTYSHLSWNRPWYERIGFSAVPPSQCGPEMLQVLEQEYRWLPMPDQRIAMRMPLPAAAARKPPHAC